MSVARAMFVGIAVGALAFVAGRTSARQQFGNLAADVPVADALTQRKRTFHLHRMPLERALGELSRAYNVSVHAQWASLSEINARPETIVTINVVDLTLQQAIEAMQVDHRPVGWSIERDGIAMANDDDAGSFAVLRVYDVGSLLVPREPGIPFYMPGEGGPDFIFDLASAKRRAWEADRVDEFRAQMERFIRDIAAAGTWLDDVGGNGRLDIIGNHLWLRQAPKHHILITQMLNQIAKPPAIDPRAAAIRRLQNIKEKTR